MGIAPEWGTGGDSKHSPPYASEGLEPLRPLECIPRLLESSLQSLVLYSCICRSLRLALSSLCLCVCSGVTVVCTVTHAGMRLIK
jgi:hypothetical protein